MQTKANTAPTNRLPCQPNPTLRELINYVPCVLALLGIPTRGSKRRVVLHNTGVCRGYGSGALRGPFFTTTKHEKKRKEKKEKELANPAPLPQAKQP